MICIFPIVGLSEKVSLLREYHRNQVVLENRTVDSNLANALQKRYLFEDLHQVQRVWTHFLAPSPWHILETASIADVAKFHQAFTPLVFSQDHRRLWRDHGLFSGVFGRLFGVLDRDDSGRVTLPSFFFGVFIFCKASIDERLRFCFDFFDVENDGRITGETFCALQSMIRTMYVGQQSPTTQPFFALCPPSGQALTVSAVSHPTPPFAIVTETRDFKEHVLRDQYLKVFFRLGTDSDITDLLRQLVDAAP